MMSHAVLYQTCASEWHGRYEGITRRRPRLRSTQRAWDDPGLCSVASPGMALAVTGGGRAVVAL